MNGQTLTFFKAGTTSYPPLVCLHGLASSSPYSFAGLTDYLKDKFHLYLFDSPAHGGTDALDNETDYRFSFLAGWLDDVFSETSPEPFFLMGHSWGAD